MGSLFAGTSSGVYAIGAAGHARLVGLPRHLITHLAAGHGTLLAAVPAHGPVHDMINQPVSDQRPGLLAAPLPAPGREEEGGELQWRHVWEGNARSCAVAEDGSWFVGTEPADVLHSADGGASWQGSNGFADLPSRSSWSFPAPPHEPHVLSIETFRPPAAGGGGGPGRPGGGGGLHVVAGVEVGGALFSTDSGKTWRERNEGLYEDVHSCRLDPHNLQRWYAVTGRGLYKTESGGERWAKLMEGLPRWYTIGLSLNPGQEGEVLVAAGDRPPSIGVHVAHSVDGGASWRDVTEEVYAGEAAEAKGRVTPVPYFFQGQALLGTDTGHILSQPAGAGGKPEGPGASQRAGWRVLCRLPHPVLCLAAPGQSPSSMMH